MNSYVIITPAYNEALYIGMAIESVIAQMVRPLLWVIVNDGSMDETAEIIKAYAQQNDWIRYVYRSKTPDQTYFGSNVNAIMGGYEQIKKQTFEYVAILDADISLPPDYYEEILKRMEADDRLGIASGVYVDNVNGVLRKVLNDRRSTPKALMVFRRVCFEQIGGFIPLAYGGEDTAACIMARMKGWKTWSFPDIKAIHHRPTGTGNTPSILRARFIRGLRDYCLGSHTLFVLGKCLRRCGKEKPYVAGAVAHAVGFFYGLATRVKRQVPDKMVKYFRQEQLDRVLHLNRISTSNLVERYGDSSCANQEVL